MSGSEHIFNHAVFDRWLDMHEYEEEKTNE